MIPAACINASLLHTATVTVTLISMVSNKHFDSGWSSCFLQLDTKQSPLVSCDLAMLYIAMLHLWPNMGAELPICMHRAILTLTRPLDRCNIINAL
jgi:hypothetical protein